MKKCLCLCANYNSYIRYLEATLPSHTRCHHIFTTSDYSYRCKDCSFGDSSCMCSDCFDVSLHMVCVGLSDESVRTTTIQWRRLLEMVVVTVAILNHGKRACGVRNIGLQWKLRIVIFYWIKSDYLFTS